MPTISVFYGITIMMRLKNKEHEPPHIHARYGSEEAAFSIADGTMKEGSLPPRAKKLVKAFILLYQKELLAMWESGNYVRLKGLE